MLAATVMLVAQMATGQVEIIEEPNASLTVKSVTKDATVHVDGHKAGEVNKTLDVYMPDDKQKIDVMVSKKGMWDILFSVPTSRKKCMVRMPKMMPGIGMAGNELTGNDINLRQYYKDRLGENVVTRFKGGFEVSGSPFIRTYYSFDIPKVKSAKYYVLRLEYVVDVGTRISRASVFGTNDTILSCDGKPHTIIVVVGIKHGWSLIDFKSVYKLRSVSGSGLNTCTLYFGQDTKGRFRFQKMFFKEIDEQMFNALSNVYRQKP